LEDSDSDGDIHLDSGSDCTGHDIVHGGLRPDGLVRRFAGAKLVKSEEWSVKKEGESLVVRFLFCTFHPENGTDSANPALR